MQLDIFEHSRDVVLRNAVIEALNRRDAGTSAAALAALVAEFPSDPRLPEMERLCRHLQAGAVTSPLAPALAATILRETEGDLVPAARNVMGISAERWLARVWSELAAAIADLPFDARNESLHPAPLKIRAGDWEAAAACVEMIASWHRQPAPLAWMTEARCRSAGLDAAWPLLAELAWMAPTRAQVLVPRLEQPALEHLFRRFNAEFEGEDTADDFAWFPAWALVADGRLTENFRLARQGADSAPERCARIVMGLLGCERQGRQADVITNRKKLRAAHAGLFAYYMQTR